MPPMCIPFPGLCVSETNKPTFGMFSDTQEGLMLRGGLLWLLGIPLPIILLLWFFGVFH